MLHMSMKVNVFSLFSSQLFTPLLSAFYTFSLLPVSPFAVHSALFTVQGLNLSVYCAPVTAHRFLCTIYSAMLLQWTHKHVCLATY